MRTLLPAAAPAHVAQEPAEGVLHALEGQVAEAEAIAGVAIAAAVAVCFVVWGVYVGAKRVSQSV